MNKSCTWCNPEKPSHWLSSLSKVEHIHINISVEIVKKNSSKPLNVKCRKCSALWFVIENKLPVSLVVRTVGHDIQVYYLYCWYVQKKLWNLLCFCHLSGMHSSGWNTAVTVSPDIPGRQRGVQVSTAARVLVARHVGTAREEAVDTTSVGWSQLAAFRTVHLGRWWQWQCVEWSTSHRLVIRRHLVPVMTAGHLRPWDG